MKYQQVINLLDNIATQPSTFRTKIVEINSELHRRYKTNSQVELKTNMLK